MDDYLIIRYGEIALKRGRRSWFEKLLKNNIEEALKGLILWKKFYPGRFVYRVKNPKIVKDKISKVFGVKSFSFAQYIKFSDLEDLSKKAGEYFKEKVRGKRFKVECHRSGSHDFTSYDVRKSVGSVLSEYGEVDVKNPEVVAYVEVREKDAYFYTEIYPGPGGLPIGSEGKLLAMVSGGFDSPVAAWYMMRRGAKVDLIYFNFAEEYSLYYTLRVYQKLLEWSIGYNNKIFIVDMRPFFEKLVKEVPEEFWMLVFKRASYRIAEKVAEKIGALGIVTGESLGQKASQTLENINSAEYGTKIPVFRPLIGLDKDEIIKTSMKIGTYEVSSEVPEFCAILAQSPRVKSSPKEIDRMYEKIKDVVENLKIEIIEKKYLDNYLKSLEEKVKDIALFEIDNVKDYEILYADELDPSKLDKNKKYLLVCQGGTQAYLEAKKLRELGFDVYATSLKILRKFQTKEN